MRDALPASFAWDNGTVDMMSDDSIPESQTPPESPQTTSEQSAPPAASIPTDATETAVPTAQSVPAVPPEAPPEEAPAEPQENFADILSQFEKSHTHKPASGVKQIEGTVVSLSAEQVFVDIGYKTEGVLPRSAFRNNAESIQPGDAINVSVKGRNEEGYYDLTLFKVSQPRDWSALQEAFEQKAAVVGTVTAVIKGGLTVDVGVRAFMPASRSGTRDAAELEKMVGTEITCRITKLDVTDENVVVDRRVVLEEQARAAQEGRFGAMQPGDVLEGTVRSLMAYGAFVDLGGVDGLLHVSDISWSRVNKPEDVLSVGQQIQVRILKIDPETKKLSLGLKQLQPEPWKAAQGKYQVGQRITGAVTRLADFGAFVEIFPGTDGLLHISEVAEHRIKDVRDELKEGDQILVKVLSIEGNRIRLSRKAILREQRAKMGGGAQQPELGQPEGEGGAAPAGEGQPQPVTFEGGGNFDESEEPNFNRDGAAAGAGAGQGDGRPDRGGDRGPSGGRGRGGPGGGRGGRGGRGGGGGGRGGHGGGGGRGRR
jgi:small subunit ribosomal protein S1